MGRGSCPDVKRMIRVLEVYNCNDGTVMIDSLYRILEGVGIFPRKFL